VVQGGDDIRKLGDWRLKPALDAQLADFVVVVLAVEDLPLLGAFEDDLALVGDLEARGCVDAGFVGKQLREGFAGFLPDGVAVFEEADLVDLRKGVGNCVGELVELVGADPHSTALYFFASSVFTFLNISAYCAPVLRISSE
jgi:hypothetical protein